LRTQLAPDTSLELGGNEPPIKFFDLLYQIEGMKSGKHHPDGCLWIRRGEHKQAAAKVSILDVLPTVLAFFGVSATGYAGRSLLDADTQAHAQAAE
jgi:predicted AlkP superfamily phosphohydrolase/phosphomutase